MRTTFVALAICIAGFVIWWMAHGDSPAGAPEVDALETQSDAAEGLERPILETRGIKTAPFEADPVNAEERGARDAKPEGAVIRGRCIDARTSSPLAGCTVELRGWRRGSQALRDYEARHGKVSWKNPELQTTGADGRFEFRFGPPPPFQFSVSAHAERRPESTVRWSAIEADAVIDLGDVPMDVGSELRGRVIDETGASCDGVSLSLTFGGPGAPPGAMAPRSWFECTSRPDGTFVSNDGRLPAGSYRVTVKAPWQLIEPESFAIDDGQATCDLEVRVRKASTLPTIAGIVVDDAVAPLRKALVTFAPRHSPRGKLVYSGDDGGFTIPRTEDETTDPVQITAQLDGYETGSTIDPVSWGTDGVRITLRRGASVEIFVRDGDRGVPLEQFAVRCFPLTGSRMSDQVALRQQGMHPGGMLRLDGVTRGRQVLIVVPTGAEWLPALPHEFEVTDGGAPSRR